MGNRKWKWQHSEMYKDVNNATCLKVLPFKWRDVCRCLQDAYFWHGEIVSPTMSTMYFFYDECIPQATVRKGNPRFGLIELMFKNNLMENHCKMRNACRLRCHLLYSPAKRRFRSWLKEDKNTFPVEHLAYVCLCATGWSDSSTNYKQNGLNIQLRKNCWNKLLSIPIRSTTERLKCKLSQFHIRVCGYIWVQYPWT